MDVTVDRLYDMTFDMLAPLVVESEQEGWRFVRRLVEEWIAGTCRFDRHGERLFAARVGEEIVGVCGLSADPYTSDPIIGRVRRLYVLRAHRGRGVGYRLVQSVVDAARGQFRFVRVRTANPEAGRLYERVGFEPAADLPDCTHFLCLDKNG
jgi:GNAT superfamily N-acetyltransferase